MQNRLTCLLGSGATIEIGAPSTNNLTNLIENEFNRLYDSGECACNYRELVDELEAHIGHEPNFEEIFHVLELMLSMQSVLRNNGEVQNSSSVIPTFMQFRERFSSWGRDVIVTALNSMTNIIGNRINIDSENFCIERYPWFANFWRRLSLLYKLDLVTLNYDTCIEQSIYNYVDGFSKRVATYGGYAYQFHPEAIDASKKTKIMHLHGCILYGQAMLNNQDMTASPYDLYKYPTYDMARQHWFSHSNPNTQSGETIEIGPIITGLRKTEKLLTYPYEFYRYEFQKAILKNNSLLVVGYSCGDNYINDLLIRMVSLHGNLRRIVWVTKIDDFIINEKRYIAEDYHPTNKENRVISQLMRMNYYYLIERQKTLNMNLVSRSYLESDDKRMRIYLNGAEDAFENHKREIFAFLKNK